MKLKSINPHNQSVVGELKISTEAEVAGAVNIAKKAFEKWRFVPIEKRVGYLKNVGIHLTPPAKYSRINPDEVVSCRRD